MELEWELLIPLYSKTSAVTATTENTIDMLNIKQGNVANTRAY